TTNFNGRKFLRLKEDQLKQMEFNNNSNNDGDDDKENKWIILIMIGVKSLRRDMLKDRILLKNNKHDNYDDDDQKEGYFNYFDYNYEDDDLKEKEKERN
ncbi:12501_t:CDS:1, partial [Entrophospora sp. SA101]